MMRWCAGDEHLARLLLLVLHQTNKDSTDVSRHFLFHYFPELKCCSVAAMFVYTLLLLLDPKLVRYYQACIIHTSSLAPGPDGFTSEFYENFEMSSS
jgi:hypothetical protein